MVLGLKSKHKKGASFKIEYIVHVQDIRPWPPSESLRSVQTVLLQWESGDQDYGSFLSVAGESNIVFNESFVLHLTLYRDKKVGYKFKKNYIEFSLFEPRKDKNKGKLLGSALLNLADYGVTEENLNISAPLSFKKSSNSLVQSALNISLAPIETDGFTSSYIDNDDNDSEIASITDDDASSHSSRTAGSFEATAASPSRNENVSMHKFSERSMTFVQKSSSSPFIISSPSSISFRDTNGKSNISASFMREGASNNSHEVIPSSKYKTTNSTQEYEEDRSFENFAAEAVSIDLYGNHGAKANNYNSMQRHGLEPINDVLTMRSDTLVPSRTASAIPPSGNNKAQLKHAKSVQIHGSLNGSGSLADIYTGEKPLILDVPNGSQKKGRPSTGIERKEPKVELSDGKKEWKTRIEMLEDELREIAAMEVGLYSVVAEHASSGNKVHTPARRLSRFYTNACRAGSQAKRASAARAAVSGLVLVSKACGNDVPRLTFWLSNSIMLRSIVSQIAAELPQSHAEGKQSKAIEDFDDWEDVLTLIMALEKVESWLFSRIVESLWWQTFTPHMQQSVSKSTSTTAVSSTKKNSGKRSTLGNYEQGNISIELWKKAFRDACERLCPIRAGGHECGCLTVLVRLVMEQLVNRLDTAMFNAILRESTEDIPTDPVSDPISDSKVLPIPAGKSSFSAGAQLKNAIGNWSRWLSDLFGLEDDSGETTDMFGDGTKARSFKAFRLLHALSDLMMLPCGMLDDVSTRKEVCPIFGPTIIKRVLNNFVPDEFSPDPIPRYIIDALDSEEISDAPGESISVFPCTAAPTKYSPPPAALLSCVGEVGSQVLQSSRLSSLKKTYTSDDELDELDSPLTSIIPDSYQSSSALAKLSLMPKQKGGKNVFRYQLLREIWRDDE